MALGEAKSKCDHIAGVPLRPNTARDLHQVYLAKGVQATTAIEGNTLSLDEVRQRIENVKSLPPSKEYLGQEIDNVLDACNWIKDELRKSKNATIEINTALIKKYNSFVLNKLDIDGGVVPGEIRAHEVGVGKYKAPDAKHCEELTRKMCEWINGPDFISSDDQRIVYGLIKAIVAHVYIAWVHPFGDGNGRTARLLEFQILLENGVPAPAAQLLSNHYNQTRAKYYRELDKTSKSGGDLIPFIQYAVQGFVDGLCEQLAFIRMQQLDVAWLNYIHQSFLDQKTTVKRRRKQLAYDLRKVTEEVPLSKITDISPAVARLYASKKELTLRRDLDDLVKKGIIEKTEKGYRSKPETILAFLPFRKL
ncbi:MAG: Fic family protein [Candidatus Hinthialibacter antarcticus]|nr:Fic family protein [Candidatus Hinthialibacter antarcticus]